MQVTGLQIRGPGPRATAAFLDMENMLARGTCAHGTLIFDLVYKWHGQALFVPTLIAKKRAI